MPCLPCLAPFENNKPLANAADFIASCFALSIAATRLCPSPTSMPALSPIPIRLTISPVSMVALLK